MVTLGDTMTRRRPLASLIAPLVLIVGVTACSNNSTDTASDSPTTTAATAAALRLNQVQMLGSHNSYHIAPEPRLLDALKKLTETIPAAKDIGDPSSIAYTHAPLDVQLDRGARTFELDIVADTSGGNFAKPKGPGVLGVSDPVVPTDMDAPGIKVLHIVDVDQISTCQTLKICLTTVRTWSQAHPNHLPIAIQLELKNDGLPKPYDLTKVTPFGTAELDGMDTEIRSIFPNDSLITPDVVRGPAADLRTAVTTTGWPTVESARGKVMFFLDNSGDSSVAYRTGAPSLQGRVAFTTDQADDPSTAVLVRNDPKDSTISGLVQQGFMIRTRADADLVEAVANDTAPRDAAFASGAQIISSDYVQGEPATTGYVVTFATPVGVRCNPVNAPKDCATPTE